MSAASDLLEELKWANAFGLTYVVTCDAAREDEDRTTYAIRDWQSHGANEEKMLASGVSRDDIKTITGE